MKKLLLTLLLGMFMISLCSAVISDFGTFKQGENITLYQICDTCTWTNLSVISPNSTILFSNKPMAASGTSGREFTYFFNGMNTTGSSGIGTYKVNGVGNDADSPSWTYVFHVTPNGETFDISKAIFYIIIVGIFLGMAIFLIALGWHINYNPAKLFLFFMAGVMFIIMLAVGMNLVSENFVNLEIANTMNNIWILVMVLLVALLAIGIIYGMLEAINAYQIKRGLKD